MLTSAEAAHLLAEHGRGAPWTQHCYAVAQAARHVGQALQRVRPVDLDHLWALALLHDIGRAVTHDPVLHGVAGFRLLSGLGHRDGAYVCASHVLFGLRAYEAARFGLPAQSFVPRTHEQRIVPLVDYLVEFDRPTTLQTRFASLRARNAKDGWFLDRLERAQAAAQAFMTQFTAETGQSVERLVAESARAALM